MASEPLRISDTLRFGDDFELDLRSYELRRAGRPVKLERIPMDLLVLLIEHRGQLVSREQIIERVWGKDVFLDTDNSINAAIRKIRQVLKDDPEKPRYVQTLTGRGYRFVATVIEPSPRLAPTPVPKSPAAPENLLGRKISNYRILELLGGGGMGVVYKAEDLKLGRRVAIKFLPAELASDPRAFERFEREARAASALDHRNICSIYQLGEYEGQPFIVMQLLEGQTVREWIERNGGQKGPQAQQQLLDLAVQIADGLEAAHQKGVIHRDIKPANIFITNRGEAKILDFGVAKFIAVPESHGETADPAHDEIQPSLTLTRTGVSVGTPSYLSPEQIRGETLDPRTDLFSFGLVLHEMATGRRAFAGDTVTVIRDAVLHDPSVPLRQLNPDASPRLEAVVTKALEKDREQRFQSAHELRSALEDVKKAVDPSARRIRIRRLWLAGAAAAFLLLAGVLYWSQVPQKMWHAASSATPAAEIKPRRAIAVIGFKNLSGKPDEDWISTALSEMFSTELAAGQQLRTVPGENVARMRLDLSLPVADSYSRETLGKINNLLNADMVVLGSYLAVGKESGGKVRIDLQLQDTRAGETVAVISHDGTEADLADLVSRVGNQLRQTLGVSVASATDAGAVRAAVPKDPQAARLYAEGLARLRNFDALAARDLLEKAIAADPNHALSHSALAQAWSALGYDAKAGAESKKAVDLSVGLSQEDRLFVEGRYRELSRDSAAAIEIYRTLRNFIPDDLDYALRLAAAQTKNNAGKDALQTVALMRGLPKPVSDDPRIDVAEVSACESLADYRRAQQVSAAAIAKAQANGNRLLLAEATHHEAWAWDRLGDLDKAATGMSRAHDLATAAGDLSLSARALRGVGIVQYDKGDLASASKAFAEALNVFQKIGSQRQVSGGFTDLGNVAYDQGKMEEARQFYESALGVDQETGNAYGIASDLGSIANVLDGLGDLVGATRMQEQSLQGFRATGNKRGELSTLGNLAAVLLERGELNSAKQYIDQAMALTQEIGYKRGRGFLLISQSDLFLAQDQLDEARKAADESIAIRTELKDDVNIAHGKLRLAVVALEQGKAVEVESLARSATGSFDAQKVADGGAFSRAVLARALLAQGKVSDSRAAADRGLALSHQATDRVARYEAILAAAEVDAASGGTSQAMKGFESVLVEATHFGFASFEFRTRLRIGEIELGSGHAASGRARLTSLQKDAQQKGFFLIARKAAASLATPPPHPKN